MPIFSKPEIARRQGKIRDAMREAGIDACVLTSADNVYYSTGVPLLSEWGRPMWSVIPTEGDVAIIGAEIERENMAQNSHDCEVLTYGDAQNVQASAVRLVGEALARTRDVKAGRVGFERSAMTVDVFEDLSVELPKAKFTDIGDIVAAVRIIKSDEESKLLRVAADVAKIGADAFLDGLSPAATELSVAAAAKAAMDTALGALWPSGATSTYVYSQFGDHTLTPHLHPTGRRLERGDLVALNVFPVVWGYCIELERTFVFGEPSDEQGRLLQVLQRSFEHGKSACLPGKQFAELHRECTEILGDAGLAEYVRHGTGHAHGIMVGAASREDLGEIREYNQGILRAGMFNSIEPGFYLPEIGGFRHSDVMAIENSASDCITEFPVEFSL